MDRKFLILRDPESFTLRCEAAIGAAAYCRIVKYPGAGPGLPH
jgi:hypothetical protein